MCAGGVLVNEAGVCASVCAGGVLVCVCASGEVCVCAGGV